MMKKSVRLLAIACSTLAVAACGSLPQPREPATSAAAVVERGEPAKIELACARSREPAAKESPAGMLSGVLDNGLTGLGSVLGSGGKDLQKELVRKNIGMVFSREDRKFCRAKLDGYECQCNTLDTPPSAAPSQPSQ